LIWVDGELYRPKAKWPLGGGVLAAAVWRAVLRVGGGVLRAVAAIS